jgi:putative membrane protein
MAINATAGRVLKLVTAPLALLTLGLSILAINMLVLLITEVLVDSLEIDGFGSFLMASLFLSVVSFLVNFVLTRRRRAARRGRR